MNIFVDTNVLIDVFAVRHPHYDASATVWDLAECGKLPCHISAISYNNIHYLMRRQEGQTKADRAMCLLRGTFKLVPLDGQVLDQAIDAKMKDFEDAIQFFSAVRANADFIITRNVKDFPRQSDIPVLTPEDFLALELDFS